MFTLEELQDSPRRFLDPNAAIERIVCHWTAGSYDVSDLDREHYHYIISGKNPKHIYSGFYTPRANDWCNDGNYAAHTYRLNTRSLGIAVACMAGASTHNYGRFPMTREQWLTMAQLAGFCASYYDLKINASTLLGHFEVDSVYGIDQGGKWDPGVFPWNKNITPAQAGARLREEAALFIAKQNPYKDPKNTIVPAKVIFFDIDDAPIGTLDGRIQSGSVVVDIAKLKNFYPVRIKAMPDGEHYTADDKTVWGSLSSALGTLPNPPKIKWDNKLKIASVYR